MVTEEPGAREFREAREAVPSAVRTLPRDFLEGNAAPLLLVIEELKRSLLTELRLVQMVERLDLSEPTEDARGKAQEVAGNLDWYVQARIFDQERTHCHNIDLIVRELIAPLRLPVAYDEEKIGKLMKLLEPLRIADNDLLDELEPIAEEARDAAQRISEHVTEAGRDPRRLDDARAEQQRFTQDMASRMARLKDLLREMSTLSNELLAEL